MTGGNGKRKLTKQQLRVLKKMLTDRQKGLLAELKVGVFGCDQRNDCADRAHHENVVKLTIQEIGRKREDLTQINLALERLEKGTYGLCLHPDCEEEFIAPERLLVQPTAIYCYACQCATEKK